MHNVKSWLSGNIPLQLGVSVGKYQILKLEQSRRIFTKNANAVPVVMASVSNIQPTCYLFRMQPGGITYPTKPQEVI